MSSHGEDVSTMATLSIVLHSAGTYNWRKRP